MEVTWFDHFRGFCFYLQCSLRIMPALPFIKYRCWRAIKRRSIPFRLCSLYRGSDVTCDPFDCTVFARCALSDNMAAADRFSRLFLDSWRPLSRRNTPMCVDCQRPDCRRYVYLDYFFHQYVNSYLKRLSVVSNVNSTRRMRTLPRRLIKNTTTTMPLTQPSMRMTLKAMKRPALQTIPIINRTMR